MVLTASFFTITFMTNNDHLLVIIRVMHQRIGNTQRFLLHARLIRTVSPHHLRISMNKLQHISLNLTQISFDDISLLLQRVISLGDLF